MLNRFTVNDVTSSVTGVKIIVVIEDSIVYFST